jgi:hypothetical protein
MILNDFIDHVRSGPTHLELDDKLYFSQPHYFNEFILVLQSNETIRDIQCGSPLQLGISEDQWVLIIKTFGSIKGIESLRLTALADGSPEFHPFRAVAEAINRAQSLCSLEIGVLGEAIPRDPSGMIALANALREHTALQDFNWGDGCSRLEATHITSLDPVLRALSACPHLQMIIIMTKYASASALKKLLQLQPAAKLYLVLGKAHWLAVADEIRQGRCNVRKLDLAMLRVAEFDATEGVKAIVSAIRLDRNLEHLHLRMQNGFTDEAGVALAEALTVNTNSARSHYFRYCA